MILTIIASPAFAAISFSEPDDFRPEWWDDADARITFDPVPARFSFGSGTADGTGSYGYDYTTFGYDMGGQYLDFLTVNLESTERMNGYQNIWIAYHYNTDKQMPLGDDYLPGSIVGYFSAGDVQNAYVVDSMVHEYYSLGNEYSGWVYINALLDPQPASETFFLQIGQSNAASEWGIDYIELATNGVHSPIPASFMLFASGIVGIFGLRRKVM